MSVKLLLLKSGEDIIADVDEMTAGEGAQRRIVGYYLTKACTVKIRQVQVPVKGDPDGETQTKLETILFPWMPLSADDTIPVVADWVVTLVNPVQKLHEMYMEKVNGKQTEGNTNVVPEGRDDTDQ